MNEPTTSAISTNNTDKKREHETMIIYFNLKMSQFGISSNKITERNNF